MRRAAFLGLLALLAGGASPASEAAGSCPSEKVSSQYARSVDRALRSGRDVWGEELIRSAAGPMYEGVSRRLEPLVFAEQRGGGGLTESGVHYLAFGQPAGPFGAGSLALHVADGSQILWDRADGPSLRLEVGGERYGACLARLGPPRLHRGYLPLLETTYVDGEGRHYAQESFAGRTTAAGPLVSFIRLTIDPHGRAVGIRFRSTNGPALTMSASRPQSVFIAWGGARPGAIGRAEYDRARLSVIGFWQRRLAEGTVFDIPESRVVDAERTLLIQNLILGWRYSAGNPYEEFSYPESVDVAQVMGDYGFETAARATLSKALAMTPERYPGWQMGEKLVAVAQHDRLFGNSRFLRSATPVLRGYLAALEQRLESGSGLLRREQYSSDIPDRVYGLHAQAVVWQGLRAVAQTWEATRQRELAQRARRLADRLEVGLRRAVRSSTRRLPDGSLFVPTRLLDHVQPYGRLTESRDASYWNLVMPFALASGLFAPGGPESRGVLRYMLTHGSRLLGLVRAGAFSLYGKTPSFPDSGTDNVYGLNVARFLADNDQPDQLVLSLYGALAAGMTPQTFIAGEAASIAPLRGRRYRSMYLPPNSAANATFLETLRLMLVHETATGLELAFATPRAWLRPGRHIAVRRAPTRFGPVSFELEAREGSLLARLTLPSRSRTSKLRLRLPRPFRITAVSVGRVDRTSETVDLSGRTGRLAVVVRYGR